MSALGRGNALARAGVAKAYPLVCHCAQENWLHKSQFETLGKLFPVREGNFPDPVILLARFGIFLTGFLGRSNPTDYGIEPYRRSRAGARRDVFLIYKAEIIFLVSNLSCTKTSPHAWGKNTFTCLPVSRLSTN